MFLSHSNVYSTAISSSAGALDFWKRVVEELELILSLSEKMQRSLTEQLAQARAVCACLREALLEECNDESATSEIGRNKSSSARRDLEEQVTSALNEKAPGGAATRCTARA